MNDRVMSHITKLKYRGRIKDGKTILTTMNNGFLIVIKSKDFNDKEATYITIYELMNDFTYDLIWTASYDKEVIERFEIISNEDYMINRLKVEI